MNHQIQIILLRTATLQHTACSDMTWLNLTQWSQYSHYMKSHTSILQVLDSTQSGRVIQNGKWERKRRRDRKVSTWGKGSEWDGEGGGGEKGRERWGEKAFYGNGADSGLSQLCSLESLFVHNHSGITWICPPPSLHTNTHSPIVIYRQRHIYRYTQVRLNVFPFIRGSLLHFFFLFAFLPWQRRGAWRSSWRIQTLHKWFRPDPLTWWRPERELGQTGRAGDTAVPVGSGSSASGRSLAGWSLWLYCLGLKQKKMGEWLEQIWVF